MAQASDWRILAEEAADEKNSEKLIEIVGALIRAIDEQEMYSSAHRKRPTSSPLQVIVRKQTALDLVEPLKSGIPGIDQPEQSSERRTAVQHILPNPHLGGI